MACISAAAHHLHIVALCQLRAVKACSTVLLAEMACIMRMEDDVLVFRPGAALVTTLILI